MTWTWPCVWQCPRREEKAGYDIDHPAKIRREKEVWWMPSKKYISPLQGERETDKGWAHTGGKGTKCVRR